MTDTTDDTTPPDLAAEIARQNIELANLRAETAALRDATDYDDLTASLDAMLSEEARAGVSKEGSQQHRVFSLIAAVLKDSQRPTVPTTDTSKPSLTPVKPDLSSLPPHARMAHGYAA